MPALSPSYSPPPNMAAPATSAYSVMPVESTAGTASLPVKATAPTPKKAVPEGFKVVKARKPDGTIVKVIRPIAPAAKESASNKTAPTPGSDTAPKAAESIATAPPTKKEAGVEASNVVRGTTANVKRAVQDPKKNVAVASVGATLPKNLSESVATTSSKPEPLPAQKDATKVPAKVAPPREKTKSAMLLNPSTYRLLQRFRGVHRHIGNVITAFDPSSDMNDVEDGGDMEDGDIEQDDDHSDGEDSADNDSDDDRDGSDDGGHEGAGDPVEGSPSNDQAQHNDLAKELGGGRGMTTLAHETTSAATTVLNQKIASTHRTVPVSKTPGKGVSEVQEKDISDQKDIEAAKPQLKGGRPLGRRFTLPQLVVWAILVLFPIFFVVLGALTASLNGTDFGSGYGPNVQQAIVIAITAWPILFAAVAAQSLKALATYRVERGIRLMALEQLLHSNSVASAIKQPFFLGRLDWTSIFLLCLWSLSPLASQAMQRMLYSAPNGSTMTGGVTYLDVMQRPSFLDSFLPQIDALYLTSIVSPGTVKSGSTDVWGFPKIPILEHLTQVDEGGWYTIDPATSDDDISKPFFSAFIGIPNLQGSENIYTYTYSIQSSYFVLNCSQFQTSTLSTINATGIPMQPSRSGTLWMGISDVASITAKIAGNALEGVFLFASQITTNNTTYDWATCGFSQSFVESQTTCTSDKCAVGKMRRSINVTSNPLDSTDLSNFVAAFANAGSSSNTSIRTPTEEYIWGGENAVEDAAADGGFADLGRTTQADFTAIISILFNTYWQIGIAPPDHTGEMGGKLNLAATTFTDTSPVYAVSWGWLAALFLASAALLAAGVASVVWGARTVSPDVLGFASSLVRQSRHITAPQGKGDGAMDGAERARLLANLRVMMQDVRPDASVGKIALGMAGDGAQRLQRGRRYR